MRGECKDRNLYWGEVGPGFETLEYCVYTMTVGIRISNGRHRRSFYIRSN